jgi:hypothetical protein
MAVQHSALLTLKFLLGSGMYQLLDASRFIVFITGATSGFGQAAARRYVAAGAKVIATGRRMDRLIDLQIELGPPSKPPLPTFPSLLRTSMSSSPMLGSRWVLVLPTKLALMTGRP